MVVQWSQFFYMNPKQYIIHVKQNVHEVDEIRGYLIKNGYILLVLESENLYNNRTYALTGT